MTPLVRARWWLIGVTVQTIVWIVRQRFREGLKVYGVFLGYAVKTIRIDYKRWKRRHGFTRVKKRQS